MKKMILFILIAVTQLVYSQQKPSINFVDALLSSEENPRLTKLAQLATDRLNIPHTIYLPQGVFIQAVLVENNQPVYTIIKDLINPYNQGETAFFEEIESRYNLTSARLHYTNGTVINHSLGYPEINSESVSSSIPFLMFLESTGDRVITIDKQTGDVINMNFIPSNTGNLDTPVEARLSPLGRVTISDQLVDVVQGFDTLGNHLGIFAPAGGANTSVADNVRGHAYRQNGNLLLTVASGANANSIAEFDPNGVYLGRFIEVGSGGLNSPYTILYRANDILISTSGSDALHRYDFNGNYLNNLWTSTSSSFFGQQMHELEDGRIILADFGVGGGLRFYSSTGDSIGIFTQTTAVRGCYKLGNGNYLLTNASGLHEINGTNGVVVRTIVTGAAGRYINPFDRNNIVPVELASFNVEINGNAVTINWSTASETNNKGFSIEKSLDKNQWNELTFVSGKGTTTQTNSYSVMDENIDFGTSYYRLKQIDFDGKFSYSQIVEVNFAPTNFELLQNYPNPFNPTTTISWQIPTNGFVSLKIYDVLGNEVQTLVKGYHNQGRYKTNFDASGLTSGIYFYELKADNYSSIKKLVLMK
ncbi:MAG: T9SS type A sorting domain-containing protein [Ignavibacteriaceae bacterium]|nr:T9SS type A sorting domain-containing protein [Ignavibacteriaceae bacterium]